MNVEQIEQQFHKLKEQWEAGNINDEQFATELEKLQFQDGQGRLWGIEALTGQWYYEEEGCWIQDEPPRELKVPPKAATAKISTSPAMTLLAKLPSLPLKAKAQIFLSYAREDEGKVEKLYQNASRQRIVYCLADHASLTFESLEPTAHRLFEPCV
jgi:hypothetical protein